jgi:hypothetical protein
MKNAIQVLLATLLAIALAGCAGRNVPNAFADPESITWSEQGWTPAERDSGHYAAAGTPFAPRIWLKSLEQATSQEMLMAPQFLKSLGFLLDTPSPRNPDGFPIGFALYPAGSPLAWNIGMTCSTCHTGQITYRGKALRIDGSQGTLDFIGFIGVFDRAVVATDLDEAKWARFAERVLGVGRNPATEAALREQVRGMIAGFSWMDKNTPPGGVATGPMRVDAYNPIGSLLFGLKLLEKSNFHAASAPASIPPLWDAWKFDWTHYNGAFNQPMARNILQVLGNGGTTQLIDAARNPTPFPDRWNTSADIPLLQAINEGFKTLKAPPWPIEMFGAYDRSKALFTENCASCHAPRPIAAPHTAMAELAVTMVPIAVIGTDPNEAVKFDEQTYDATKLTGQAGARVSGATGLQLVLGELSNRAYDLLGYTTEQRAKANGNGRPNMVRAPRAYKARTLDGIWATAPYLHNGSVPNIYELLSPLAERSSTFWLGNFEYDPVKLGYVGGELNGGFLFDTRLSGNANTGHVFSDDRSSPVALDYWP